MTENNMRAIRFIEKVWSDAVSEVVQADKRALVIRADVLTEMVEKDDLAGRLVFDELCEKHPHLQTNRERQLNGAILLNLAMVYKFRGDESLMVKLEKLGMLWR